MIITFTFSITLTEEDANEDEDDADEDADVDELLDSIPSRFNLAPVVSCVLLQRKA